VEGCLDRFLVDGSVSYKFEKTKTNAVTTGRYRAILNLRASHHLVATAYQSVESINSRARFVRVQRKTTVYLDIDADAVARIRHIQTHTI
jgi:hypothetical protein